MLDHHVRSALVHGCLARRDVSRLDRLGPSLMEVPYYPIQVTRVSCWCTHPCRVLEHAYSWLPRHSLYRLELPRSLCADRVIGRCVDTPEDLLDNLIGGLLPRGRARDVHGAQDLEHLLNGVLMLAHVLGNAELEPLDVLLLLAVAVGEDVTLSHEVHVCSMWVSIVVAR